MAAKTLSPTVSKTTLAHIDALIRASINYAATRAVVRSDYREGRISKENARIALATGYVHHECAELLHRDDLSDKQKARAIAELQAQRDDTTGMAVRSSALEQRVNRELRGFADKMSAKVADKIVLTAAQVRLLKELDATFETYAAMRKGILSYIATAQ